MPLSGEIDAIAFDRQIRDTYLRYLYTTNMISDQEPELQKAFYDKLRNEFKVIKGPFVHCMPCYKPSYSLKELTDGKGSASLSPEILKLPKEKFDSERSLYSHQVSAIEHIQNQKNLVVATGTGSGKTECFLLPILNDILKDPSPGLRAIIIYPMNALANDQLNRLRELLKDMPQVTFGRYTGETPWKEDKKNKRPEACLKNEKYFRTELRESPPHIFLTNFAMLEYLLLRPKDSALFRNHKLRFVVLDEAHTYSGAQGIEIALLMRRLKQYLGCDEEQLRFILTSATLGDQHSGTQDIARFAANLTGTSFTADDVLQGETVDYFETQLEDRPRLDEIRRLFAEKDEFQNWAVALKDSEKLLETFKKSGLNINISGNGKHKVSRILYDILSVNSALEKIHKHCRKKPATLKELCKVLDMASEDKASERAVRWLITMGAYARKTPDSAPLLPTRLHFFTRGLAGATICLNPECPGKADHPNARWSSLFLEDVRQCPHCEKRVLPVSTCFHCGLPVIRVFLGEKSWTKRPASFSEPDARLLTWADELFDTEDSSEEDELNENDAYLCLNCGVYNDNKKLSCCLDNDVIRLRRIPNHDENGNLSRCPCCNGGKGYYDSVLREFRTQENAPTAVLSEIIIRNLPYENDREHLPANGRNLLVFSDSRQRAAFFAPYLYQTMAETAYFGPLKKAIENTEKSEGRPVSIEEITDEYKRRLSDMNTIVLRNREEGEDYFDLVPRKRVRSAQKTAARKEAEIVLYRNFCASGKQKTTLHGMGIASLTTDFNEDEREKIPQALPELFKDGDEKGWQTVQAMVDIFVQRRAVEFPDYINAKLLTGYGKDVYTFHRTESGDIKGRHRYRWNPYNAPDRSRKRAITQSLQLTILCKILKLDKKDDSKKLSEILDGIWDSLRDGILAETESWPGEYRIGPECLQITRKKIWYRCDRCGRMTTLGKLGICLSPDCLGTPLKLSPDDKWQQSEKNHYCQRYKLDPLPIEVKEHTAQLTNERGKKYQEKFMRGEVNVLSSSTTFEMGIDVGNLKSVLLRNVPPTTSSYVQRAGRAGRRKDGISVAVTYSANVPHDQYHFQRPEKMIQGEMAVPFLNIENVPLAQRHCNSALLGYFLRDMNENDVPEKVLEKTCLQHFFFDEYDGEKLAEHYAKWCHSPEKKREHLAVLKSIIPEESGLSAETALENSVESLCGEKNSILKREVEEPLARFNEQIEDMTKQWSDAKTRRQKSALNNAGNSLDKLREQFLNERLINFLSSCAWLPGYAFPQDIVKLLIRQTEYADRMRMERDREIGISEYAPGSEVIADGKLFRSGAVWYKSKEPDIRWYVRCPDCRTIETTKFENERPPKICRICGKKLTGNSRKYFRPDGFSTLVKDVAENPRLHRRPPPPTSEIFLLEGTEDDKFEDHSVRGISYGVKEDGKLFRANSNYKYKGFHICRKCGRGFDSFPKNKGHESPWGGRCGGKLVKLDLAHEIVTDILQLRFQNCSPHAPSVQDKTFWHSLLAAVLNGAGDALDIAAGDIDGTYHGWREGSNIGELVIYDRIPGGAGYIFRINQNLDKVLKAALARVEDCECKDENSSCYACLRSYKNQFYWEHLQRKPVIEWLRQIT